MRENKLSSKRIIIFGTGSFGKYFYEKFGNNNNILCFVDNQKHYDNELLYSKNVYQYNKCIIDRYIFDFIVVCSEPAKFKILEQLVNDGIKEEQILIGVKTDTISFLCLKQYSKNITMILLSSIINIHKKIFSFIIRVFSPNSNYSKILYKIIFDNPVLSLIVKIKKIFFCWVIKNQCKSVGERLLVNHWSSVTSCTVIGNYVNFNGMEISGGGTVKIGNFFHSGRRCHIITHVHNYDKGQSIPYDSTYYHKDVTIEDCVWLGEGVTILGGVTIGEGAIIQAYSTVVCDIPAYGIAGGHPAKVYKYRDINHYKKMKERGWML